MSVLSNLPVMPNRIAIACEYFYHLGPDGDHREDIEKQLSPLKKSEGEEGVSSSTIASHLISEMEKLQLLSASSENANTLRLSPDIQKIELSSDEWMKILRPILWKRMAFPDLAESYGQKEFPDALSWLLNQNPFQPLPWKGGEHAERIVAQLGETDPLRIDIGNNSRYQNLLYWARYFGCAEWIGIKTGNVVIPDPSEVILWLIPHVFADDSELPIQTFIQRLGEVCPVLDGGSARRNFETRLTAEFQRQEYHLSRSTSLALKRLQLRGIITIKAVSDAQTWILDLANETQAVSHIKITGEVVA